jgi:tetratricopeptide (TPR) repeat protein
LEAGDLAAAGRWIARLDTAVKLAGVEGEPAGLRARLAKVTLLVLRGTVQGTDEEIEAVILATAKTPRIAARAWMLKGRRLTRKRRFDAAFDALNRASGFAGKDAVLSAQIEVTRGNLLLHLDRVDEAEAALRRARPGARALPADLGRIALAAARVALRRGRSTEAAARASEAGQWFLAAGSAWGRLASDDLLADLAAESGDLITAEARYRETERGYRSLGLRQAEVSRLHLAWLALRLGRYPEARATFDHAIGVFAAWRAPLYLDLAWAGRLAADAAAGDAGAFDEAFEHLHQEREGGWNTQVRSCLREAARLARVNLDARRAGAAAALSEAG